MSSYDFDIIEAQNLVRDLIQAGWTPPEKDGNRQESDLIMLHAQILRPLLQEYMPTYYPEGGGP
jgi:hypothetical protein